jgi:hypothetical protein
VYKNIIVDRLRLSAESGRSLDREAHPEPTPAARLKTVLGVLFG